jgi:hypothetical protein
LIYDNQITNVPLSIMNLTNLSILRTDCAIDPIINRFINKNKIKNNKTLYKDAQNVHDSDIVNSIKQSIYNIISDSKDKNDESLLKNIFDDDILNKTVKQQLIEYSYDKTVHSILNVTFEEVLCSVWKIISEHKESNEIKKILNEEMKDSMCKCFTGRLSRLVNCLNGFDSRIFVRISDTQEILNIIIRMRKEYINDNEKQKEEIIKELTKRGYDKGIINEFVTYLD